MEARHVLKSLKYAWLVAVILFLFRSFHQTDIYVISVVLPQILEEFQITYALAGAMFTATTVLSVVFYPVWGYLFDRYSRRLLLSLTGMLWGLTTLLSTVPRTFAGFLAARALTGADNTPPAGIHSLLSDYFPPKKRGKPFGLISSAGAFGALLGTIVGVQIGYALGWRYLFLVTGGLGMLMAVVVYFVVRDVPRGSSEPELSGLELKEEAYRIRFRQIFGLVKRPSMLFISLQGFFGVFPWQALTAWAFTYLLLERGFREFEAMLVMLVWLTSMIVGNLVGGAVGDFLFSRNISGRAILGAVDVFLSALLIYLTITWPLGDVSGFIILGTLTCFVMPMAGPNVSASITDFVEPEARSSADSLLRVFETAGSSTAPLIVGFLADIYGLGMGILMISASTWVVCGALFSILVWIIRKDITKLRNEMKNRAEMLRKTYEPQ
ncbi:MAG: MFS transporter [Nitrososphaerota archaeon]|nr:MFS transporter [Candidatus Calditenuaceae archaeon]MDW8073777.1 MFS transporter [Nitrososphaerota archaeon]